MLMLVTSDNLLQLFFGWEGVGLASYLLIGFWYQKPSASAAAIKAFIVNRVGDFGFALGIFALFLMTKTVSYDLAFAQAETLAKANIHFLGYELPALTTICLLLFMGAMGKSAQFLLHTWLPDAMEGPTPVSALIHAATMVTAGVFMVARLSPLFQHSPVALEVVIFIGATTAFFAATIGVAQNDIKRVIAYSTCSQLGYMFVGMGVSAYSVGMFHLFTHAFFKALLFLGAGSVIHAMHHEQDLRKMGGLWKKIPITFVMMIIGTLALTGFPFTAGYFSKDMLIEATFGAHSSMGMYAFVLLVAAAFLTSFYSWRLIFMAFFGKARHDEHTASHVHESPYVMLVPLGFLALGALAAGLAFSGFFTTGHEGSLVSAWLGQSHKDVAEATAHVLHAAHETPALIAYLPTVMMAAGFALAWYAYIARPDLPGKLATVFKPVYLFLYNKWYFDELYDRIFVRPMAWIARVLWKVGDGLLIDGLGPDGISARVLSITKRVVRLQTGFVYHYAFVMLIGIVIFVSYFAYWNWHELMGGIRP
jgi:NADH-quinone oxidoreductase subunit L